VRVVIIFGSIIAVANIMNGYHVAISFHPGCLSYVREPLTIFGRL